MTQWCRVCRLDTYQPHVVALVVPCSPNTLLMDLSLVAFRDVIAFYSKLCNECAELEVAVETLISLVA